jgi:hypothetical protein
MQSTCVLTFEACCLVSVSDIPAVLQELLLLHNSVATSVKMRGNLLAAMNDEAVKYQSAITTSNEVLLAAKKKLVLLESSKTDASWEINEHQRQLEVLYPSDKTWQLTCISLATLQRNCSQLETFFQFRRSCDNFGRLAIISPPPKFLVQPLPCISFFDHQETTINY